MLTDSTRKVVEAALGRALNAQEEAGFPTLAALPKDVIAAAQKIRKASNSVAVSVYLQHVVPTAALDEIREYIGELPADISPPLTDEDRALVEKMRAAREQRMQRYAHEGRPKPLPADSPIFKKWEADPFPGGPDREADTKPPLNEQQEIAYFLDLVLNGEPQRRASALRSLGARPLADATLLAACERLLEDRTMTLLSIPYSFGEVRWMAVEAVAAIRGRMGRTEPVVIEDAFSPVSTDGAYEIATDAGVPESPKSGNEGVIETLELVAAAGKLPRRRIKRDPSDWDFGST